MQSPAEAIAAFEGMVEAAKSAGVPTEINLTARPVVSATHVGETIPIVDSQMPEGTVPPEDQPDALAVELRVGGQLGRPLPTEVTEKAAELGLRIATSDTLLI